MIAMLPLMAAAVCSAAVVPHDPGLSSLRVVRSPECTVVHLAFNNADFAAALGADVDADRDGVIVTAELLTAQARLAAAMAAGVRVGVVAGDLVATAIAENQDVELTLRFPAAAAAVSVDVALLQRFSRGHRCYAAEVTDIESSTVLADSLLKPGAHSLQLPAPQGRRQSSGFGLFGQFVWLGIEHILIGFDHLAFLLALLAGGLARRQIVTTITAFTAAHSITLLLAAGGLLTLPGLFVEATIAGSIVVVAVLNLLRNRAAHRWPLAFGFGLIHGFGFAGVVADLGIGGPDGLWPVVAFNVGVEIGQLAFAAVAVPLLMALGRRFRTLAVRNAVSLATGLAGLFWLCERLAA